MLVITISGNSGSDGCKLGTAKVQQFSFNLSIGFSGACGNEPRKYTLNTPEEAPICN